MSTFETVYFRNSQNGLSIVGRDSFEDCADADDAARNYVDTGGFEAWVCDSEGGKLYAIKQDRVTPDDPICAALVDTLLRPDGIDRLISALKGAA